MKRRVVTTLLAVFILTSCATRPDAPVSLFQLAGRDYLYDKHEWGFSGRAAVSNEKESFSLSVLWTHRFDADEIELAGPFGQGRTIIHSTSKGVDFDFGDKKLQFTGNVDEQIAMHTGIAVPVSALKYWVIGLVDPKHSYVMSGNGFLQSDWIIKYEKMRWVDGDELPQKIKIEKVRGAEQAHTKLKLIIDHWDIN